MKKYTEDELDEMALDVVKAAKKYYRAVAPSRSELKESRDTMRTEKIALKHPYTKAFIADDVRWQRI